METNNYSSVKNYQSDEAIKRMYKNAFQVDPENIKISKLSGGLKNAVYLIEDGTKKIVLKIAPKDESKMITADRNILWWEAEMLEKMEELELPTPKLLYFDDSHSICEEPYIFMSYLSGENYLQCKENLSKNEVDNIEKELGLISAKICSIHSDQFFLPAQPDKIFNNNYEFVLNLFELLLHDAKSKDMDLGKNNYQNILNIINSKRDSLNNISNLCLSHTDIWDGNVLVDKGRVSGIVDFTDLYYCDELMTFYFHTIDGKTSEQFLTGFNNKCLNDDEIERVDIYRMYVILKMIVDCELKQYGKFDWMYENLNCRIENLQKTKVLKRTDIKNA